MKQLPKANYPIYTIEIPSTKEKKHFRPFLVKENKILMIAQSSEDEIIMIDSLKSVIQSTCMDEIDVDELAVFDLEYILVKLRSISIGTGVVLRMRCDAETGHEEERSRYTTVNLNLDDIEVEGIEQFKRDVKLSDDLVLKMKIPNFEFIKSVAEHNESDYESNIALLAKSIDKIITSDEVIDVETDTTIEDMIEWIQELTEEQYDKIIQYFQSIPKCRIKVEWNCENCGKHNSQYITGIIGFF